jgi:hypothetical protein
MHPNGGQSAAQSAKPRDLCELFGKDRAPRFLDYEAYERDAEQQSSPDDRLISNHGVQMMVQPAPFREYVATGRKRFRVQIRYTVKREASKLTERSPSDALSIDQLRR